MAVFCRSNILVTSKKMLSNIRQFFQRSKPVVPQQLERISFQREIERQTDESKKMEKLILHEKGIGWFIDKAKGQGVEIERTYGDDPDGDIYCPDPANMDSLKALTRKLKQKYSKF
jgi:hypothetical protein